MVALVSIPCVTSICLSDRGLHRQSKVKVLKLQDDLWRPLNLQNETECNKFVEDMASVGLDIKDSVYSK